MKVPLSWLKEFVDINLPPVQIAHVLTQAGIEVEGMEAPDPGYKGIVIARVIEVTPHPNADKLVLATVSDGVTTHRVVCGAPNCRPGLKTALAVVGAEIREPDGKIFKIKRSKIRGEESCGMLCSGKELGISEESDGILEFAEQMKEGADLAGVYSDVVFDLALTPNLSHAGSVVGIARELAAHLNLPLKARAPYLLKESATATREKVVISVEQPEACPRYAARLIEGVKVAPSPDWLKKRLEACGFRSVNNIVDVTNLVLHELGQPLHAFDFDKIEGKKIVVRYPKNGKETLLTLDGKTREVEGEALLICDAVKPLAIAGVMGGAESEVTDATQSILLESAYFNPSSIRRTSKKLQLSSEASKRFERGVDPNLVVEALDLAAALIQTLAGGVVCMGPLDCKTSDFRELIIPCRLSRINQILGTRLSVDEVEKFFSRLQFKTSFDGQDTFKVTVPTFRVDITSEIDLVEEAARLYGYENFAREPSRFQATQMAHAPAFVFEREVRRKLVQEGLQEFVNCDLIGPSLLKTTYGTEEAPEGSALVLNPVSVEQSILRTSLLPGLLAVAKHNFDRECKNIAGFEIGRIHFKSGEKFEERTLMALILTGKSSPNHFEPKPHDFDFRDLKGIIENLLTGLGIDKFSLHRSSLPTLHPGRQATLFIGGQEVGAFGEIHPSVQRRLDLPQRLLFAEFDLYDLFRLKRTDIKMKALSTFPASERDWTITLLEKASIQQVVESVKSFPSPLLEKIELIDIYRSPSLGMGKKNATFRFIYRDKDKTIEQEAVDKEHARLIQNTLQLIPGCLPPA